MYIIIKLIYFVTYIFNKYNNLLNYFVTYIFYKYNNLLNCQHLYINKCYID